jgi:hypothetical protein
MGYTHYWYQKRDFTAKEWGLVQERAEKIARENPDLLAGYDGSGEPIINAEIIQWNGAGEEDSYETFQITQKQREPYEDESKEKFEKNGAFDFCKTAQRPYDAAVVTMLAFIDKNILGVLTVCSDGGNEAIKEIL